MLANVYSTRLANNSEIRGLGCNPRIGLGSAGRYDDVKRGPGGGPVLALLGSALLTVTQVERVGAVNTPASDRPGPNDSVLSPVTG